MAVKVPPRLLAYSTHYDVPLYLTQRLLAKLSPSYLSHCLDDSIEPIYFLLRTEIEKIDHNLDPEGKQFKDKPKLHEKMTELIYKALLGMDFASLCDDLAKIHLHVGLLALLASVYNFWNSFGLTNGWLPTCIAIIWLVLAYMYYQVQRVPVSTVPKETRAGHTPYESLRGRLGEASTSAWASTIFLSVQIFDIRKLTF